MGLQRLARVGLVVALTLAVPLSAQVAARVATEGGSSAPARSSVAPKGVHVTWATTRRVLDDGRAYFLRAPHCNKDNPACTDLLARPREVVFFLHGAGGPEDRDTAASWLQGLNGFGPDTIFVYGVSQGGTKRFDAGFCCTEEPVDDVGYLMDVVDDIASDWGVDRDRVGATGLSNGGMLALRAGCERPDVFSVVVGLAATYPGSCDAGRLRVGQWHGGEDTTVPLEGGTVTILGHARDIPPVASLAQRMARGSVYMLRVIPGRGHSMTWKDFGRSTTWLLENFR
ncbi:PHB depolymerase family esterase [Nocardioides sp. MH1]|uniref:alpha/beta hydrolase family esterase n=1 Tax=Nocardioides sp. MH1 TaxID=3242490 RepID=UPI003521FBF4